MDYDTELERLQAALGFDMDDLKLNRINYLSQNQEARYARRMTLNANFWFVGGICFFPLACFAAIWAMPVIDDNGGPEFWYIRPLIVGIAIALFGVGAMWMGTRIRNQSALSATTCTAAIIRGREDGLISADGKTLQLPPSIPQDLFTPGEVYTVYFTNSHNPVVVSAEPGDVLGIAKKKKKRSA